MDLIWLRNIDIRGFNGMEKKRGILNIIESSVWGGMEQYVYDMSEELKRQEIVPFILTDGWKIDFVERYKEVATVFTCTIRKSKWVFSLNKIATFIRKHHIDTILCHTGKYILLSIILKKMTGVKVIFLNIMYYQRKRISIIDGFKIK